MAQKDVRGYLERPDDACRVACRDRIRRDISGDDRPRPDDRPVADRDARAYDHPAAQPAVVADDDGLACFEGRSACCGVERVVRREQLHFGAYERPAADAYRCQVEEDAVEIDEGTFAHVDVVAVVAVERFADEPPHVGA